MDNRTTRLAPLVSCACSRSPQDLRRIAERAETAWTDLHDALHDLQGRDAEHAREMGRALEEDFDRLLEMIRRDR